MNCRKVTLGIFVATLGASFMHQTGAQWLSGGSTTISRKSNLSGFDLFCDLTRSTFGGVTIPPADRMRIDTLPSAANPSAPASLTFSGELFCAEVLLGQSGLENAQNGLVGRFRLIQRSPAQRPTSTLTQTETGLVFNQVGNIRTWTFFVPEPTAFPFPELLYDLAPADEDTAAKFCESGENDCKALIGLQLPANQADYQPRDIDGLPGDDLALGEVFKFTTTTTNGTEAPGKFFWGPCHSQALGTAQTFIVDALANGSHDVNFVLTPEKGKETNISLTAGQRIAVTVNQNDLWTQSTLAQFGPNWSNADGQIREMIATGHDDSSAQEGVQAGDVIGTNNPDKLAGMLFRWNGSAWVPATEAAIGTLVGSTNDQDFYIFGTAFDGPAPASGPLKLYVWDRSLTDLEFVTVTVATESIRCKVVDEDGAPTDVDAIVAGDARGERKVEVEGFPTLNVDNKSKTATFPFAVLGCNQGDAQITFARNGSPITVGNQVLVNNKPVPIKGFNVGDKVSRPECDGGQKLADLQLQLNRDAFIDAVAPDGKCENGINTYFVTVGQGTFYGGQDTVELSNCN